VEGKTWTAIKVSPETTKEEIREYARNTFGRDVILRVREQSIWGAMISNQKLSE
jgi:hypothetical protein